MSSSARVTQAYVVVNYTAAGGEHYNFLFSQSAFQSLVFTRKE